MIDLGIYMIMFTALCIVTAIHIHMDREDEQKTARNPLSLDMGSRAEVCVNDSQKNLEES